MATGSVCLHPSLLVITDALWFYKQLPRSSVCTSRVNPGSVLVFKVIDENPGLNLGSSSTVTNMSHWWCQDGLSCLQKSGIVHEDIRSMYDGKDVDVILEQCWCYDMQETSGTGQMLKRQLMEAAQPLSEQSFTIVRLYIICSFSCVLSRFLVLVAQCPIRDRRN